MNGSIDLHIASWIGVIAGLVIVGLLVAGLCQAHGKRNHRKLIANIAVGTHESAINKLADAAITVRHLLVKDGSDDAHAAVCGATDLPLGTCPDEPSAAEELHAVLLLGKGHTKRMVVADGVTVAVGDRLYTAAGGYVTNVPVLNSYFVGVCLTIKGLNDEVEVEDCPPIKARIGYEVIAAGIHDWAGGAATTDSISVTGLLATDVVHATLVARASTETLVLVTNDAGNDQIDLTLSANGTDTTTKVSYSVLRAIA